jgi:hypothetical protein
MNVIRYIIGLVLAITGSVTFLGWMDQLQDLSMIFLGMAALGLILIIASGFEGRLAVGILCLIGDFILFGQWGMGEIANLVAYVPIAVVGLVLILSAIPKSLESMKSFTLRRGGYQGTVRNLMKEGGLMNFWLDGAGFDGTPVRVEGMISEGLIGEGDAVWVGGSLNERGLIRTNRVQKLSKIEASKSLARKGKAEFSGIVVGEIYQLPRPTLFGLIPLLPFLTFFRPKNGLRIQRVTADGSPLDLIEAEIFALDFVGVVLDRDLVKVKGEWQESGRFRISEIENLTSKTRAR